MDIDDLLADLSDDDVSQVQLEPDHIDLDLVVDEIDGDALDDDPDSAAQRTVSIDASLVPISAALRNLYYPRYPELSSLLPDLQEFLLAVEALGPEVDATAAAAKLDTLGKARSLAIQMSASEARGSELSPEQWQEFARLEKHARQLLSKRQAAIQLITDHLQAHAPNLLAIVSLPTAVHLVAYTGGLAGLSKATPANLPSLGAPKQRSGAAGDSQARQGVLFNDPLVSTAGPAHRRQALRAVSGKVVLAARMDLARSSTDGSQGRKWRLQIEERLEKLGRAPALAQSRALPVPEDKTSKKRGGRRIRKMKEKLMPSELQRQRDRLQFGHAPDSL